MIVVNLFGAPGAGKSTAMAYIFSKLKMRGVNVELAPEYAKDKVWEENKVVFKNQIYIFGHQLFKLSRLKDKVDVVVTDAPLMMSIIYGVGLPESFYQCVYDVDKTYNSMNYFLTRDFRYNHLGRFQSEEEAEVVGNDILNMFKEYNVKYQTYSGSTENYDKIVDEVCDALGIEY